MPPLLPLPSNSSCTTKPKRYARRRLGDWLAVAAVAKFGDYRPATVNAKTSARCGSGTGLLAHLPDARRHYLGMTMVVFWYDYEAGGEPAGRTG